MTECTHEFTILESDGNIYCEDCDIWIENLAAPGAPDPSTPTGERVEDHY